MYFIVGSDQKASPEMEIVVEETASVKEVSQAAFKSFCHAWVRCAAPGELCLTPVRHFRPPRDTEAKEAFQLQKASGEECLDLSPSSKETSLLFAKNEHSPAASCMASRSFYTQQSSE